MRASNIHIHRSSTVGGISLAMLLSTSAQGALTISSKPTANVNCAAGVCIATANEAVLNVTDLTNMLAAGSLSVQSGSQAQDIVFNAPFSWTSSNALTLDSYRSITVNRAVSDSGPAPLTLTTDDGGKGGDLLFGNSGKIGFLNVGNALTINGQAYTLVQNIGALASTVAANPYAILALANDYDAGPDGTYSTTPVPTIFYGEFEGLGNSIANLAIDDSTDASVALFAGVRKINGKHPHPGTLRDISLINANIVAHSDGAEVGALAAGLVGPMEGVRVSGQITSTEEGMVGGVVGYMQGNVTRCSSTAKVTGAKNSEVGGLLGHFTGSLSASISTGTVSGNTNSDVGGLIGTAAGGKVRASFSEAVVSAKSNANVGGLIGVNVLSVVNSYAIGKVSAGSFSNSGGLIGMNDARGPVILSYSTGAVSGGVGSFLGGFVGDDTSAGEIRATYWDVDASGQSKGAGNIDEGGMTGLTTQEFQAGLPPGFKKNIWAENPKINNGYPYLIMNPPPK